MQMYRRNAQFQIERPPLFCFIIVGSSAYLAGRRRPAHHDDLRQCATARDRDRHFRTTPATFIKMPIVGMFHTSERISGKFAVYSIA
jgi:hypothetical protein